MARSPEASELGHAAVTSREWKVWDRRRLYYVMAILPRSGNAAAPDPGICYGGGGAVYQRGGNVCEAV